MFLENYIKKDCLSTPILKLLTMYRNGKITDSPKQKYFYKGFLKYTGFISLEFCIFTNTKKIDCKWWRYFFFTQARSKDLFKISQFLLLISNVILSFGKQIAQSSKFNILLISLLANK